MKHRLKSKADILGIYLDDTKLSKFKMFSDMLIEWNKKMNLTRITDQHDIIDKHFIDSLTLLKTGCIKKSDYVIDVGTGAGFPGIPLKIAMPDINIVLIDALNKRVQFLREVIKQLKLNNIQVIHDRAEQIGKDERYRSKFDVCVSRAVAPMNILCEYCIPLIKLGGIFISQKAKEIKKELNDSQMAIELLGGSIRDIMQISIPETDIQRNLIIIDKIKPTPTKFPRKTSKIKKYPIIKEK